MTMKTANLLLLLSIIFIIGCKERILAPDMTPPVSPSGLYTFPGDGAVEVHWAPNPEMDIAGYNVYSGTALRGKYDLVGTTRQNYFIDSPLHDGVTYYYTVTAYDHNGNESAPGFEIVYDTPRPEGYGIRLYDYISSPDAAGYDFSSNTVGPYDDKYADMFYEYSNGRFYMDVWKDSDIQDMGFTNSLYTVGDAPEGGWSPTKDVPLIVGHTYVVWTWDNHFAKFRVLQLSTAKVVFDWVYQLQEGNPRLAKGSADRGTLAAGEGFKSRH